MTDNTAHRFENETCRLRFIERDGRRILQQQWEWSQGGEGGNEWKDVPLVSEEP
jgi:hypothetical protein